jgi:hypothetical protein
MRRTAATTLFLSMIFTIALAFSYPTETLALDDSPMARAMQADRYLKAMPPKEMFEDLAKQMSQNMPPEQAKKFQDVMTKQLDLTALQKAMRDAMIKHFTADELRALADFYGSEVGKSAMTKFGPYMVEVMPAMQAEILKAQAKIAKEMEGAGNK